MESFNSVTPIDVNFVSPCVWVFILDCLKKTFFLSHFSTDVQCWVPFSLFFSLNFYFFFLQNLFAFL